MTKLEVAEQMYVKIKVELQGVAHQTLVLYYRNISICSLWNFFFFSPNKLMSEIALYPSPQFSTVQSLSRV